MTLLITAEQVIDNALTHKNVNKTLIKDAFIRASQEDYIRPVLNDLYPILLQQIEADNVTTVNQTLLDEHIIPTMAFYVKAQVLPDLSLQQTSSGVVQFDNEFSSPVTNQQRADLIAKSLDIGDSLRDEMIRFLEDDDNKDDYPDYKPTENVSNQVTNFGGIVVDTPQPTSTTPEDRR